MGGEMVLYLKNKKITAQKTKKPKFKTCFGRTWDLFTFTIDDIEYEGVVDTTWGKNFYFCKDKNWYKVNMIKNNLPDPLYSEWEFTTERR